MIQKNASSQARGNAIQYCVCIRKDSLAARGIQQHMQRFHSRYEAGWLATLIEEFYVLLDGEDPRASLLYPLLYQCFESGRQIPCSSVPSQQEGAPGEERLQGDDTGLNLADVAEMSENLQGYFEEEGSALERGP